MVTGLTAAGVRVQLPAVRVPAVLASYDAYAYAVALYVHFSWHFHGNYDEWEV